MSTAEETGEFWDDLDDAVDGLTWYDAQHSTKRGRPTDLSVKRIFPHL